MAERRINGSGTHAASPGEAIRVPSLRDGLLIVLTLILIGAALRAMAVVVVPLIVAVLTALAVMPVRDWVARHLPRWLGWLGPLAAMLLLLLMLAFFVGGLYLAARQLVTQIPAPVDGIAQMLEPGGEPEGGNGEEPSTVVEAAEAGADAASDDGVGAEAEGSAPRDGADRNAEGDGAEDDGAQGGGEAGARQDGFLGLGFGTVPTLLERFGDRALGAAGGVATSALNAATSIVTALVIVLFITLLILFESGHWASKVATVTGQRAEWQLLESADVIASKVRSYFLVQGGIGLATAVLYGLWLWVFGVDLLLVWVSVTFLLTFIPVLGSLIAGLLPVAYTLLTKDLGTALMVGLGILAIEQVMGNFVEPRLQGRNIALSPLVVLVSLLFWGWVWGLAGALLAVPVTVALVVLGSHVPALRPWALMLTDQVDMKGLEEVTTPE